MALGNILSLSCPSGYGIWKMAEFSTGGVRPQQEDRLGVAECTMPIGVEKEDLSQRAGRGHQHRLHLPALKNVPPAGPELHSGLKLAQEVVAIEVRPAVHKYTIFRI